MRRWWNGQLLFAPLVLGGCASWRSGETRHPTVRLAGHHADVAATRAPALPMEAERWKSADRLERGLTVLLPGVEGASLLSVSIARGLVMGGHPAAIVVDDWTTGKVWRFARHLRDSQRHRQEAWRIAKDVLAYREAYPGRPVRLIGHSGGGGMAVFVLEALPEGTTIEQAVLIAPAISPDYNLTDALKRVDGGLWNFSSRGDFMLLGLGTLLLGTVDGEHAMAAGAVGFRLPATLSEQGRQLYQSKLREAPFQWSSARDGHLGGHFGATHPKFVARVIAPLLVDPTPVESSE